MDKRDTLVIDENGVCHNLNGGVYKNTAGILSMLEESNIKENKEKLTLALQNAYKCNKSSWLFNSIAGALAIVLGGVAATIAALIIHNPLVLLAVDVGVITLAVGDQIFRVESNDHKNVSKIKDICEKHGIAFHDVSNTKSATKSNDGLVTDMVSESPLNSLGKTFSASGAKVVQTPSSEPVKLEVPRLGENKTAESEPVDLLTVDAPINNRPAKGKTVEQVKSNNDVSSSLSALRSAFEAKKNAGKTATDAPTAEVVDKTSEMEHVDDTHSA